MHYSRGSSDRTLSYHILPECCLEELNNIAFSPVVYDILITLLLCLLLISYFRIARTLADSQRVSGSEPRISLIVMYRVSK